MSIYFAFSDESGSYRQIRGKRFLRAHPWYVRATLCIDARDWKDLEGQFLELKHDFQLPQEREIKWSFVWSLRSHAKTGKVIAPKMKYYFLRKYDPDALEEFLSSAIGLLRNLRYCRVIFTLTENASCPAIRESRLLKMHLQESMQRVEMDMQTRDENLCVLFIDTVSKEKDETLRDAYSELYQNGDIINRYRHIKDSLNLEYSHHSVGIQVADYLAGAFSSLVSRYPAGKAIYRQTICNVIRTRNDGAVAGYGFREVPGNKPLRAKIVQQLDEAMAEN